MDESDGRDEGGSVGPRPRAVAPVVSGAGREVLPAIAALVLVLALGTVFNYEGQFFARGTHADALWQIAGYGILACGMTVVIISGGIDLAVGSVVALCGVVFALLVIRHGWPAWAAIPSAAAVGGVAGLASGSLVAFARVQPFIATLAMMAFARGLAKSAWISGNTKITVYPTPEAIEVLNTRLFVVPGLGISVGVFVFLACAALTFAILRWTTLGVHLYAIGDNEEAARYAGLPVRRAKVLAYTYCGALAGVAGVLFAATERQGNPDGGVGYELTAIAMVVIGGTSLRGGKGGVVLTLLGALTIGYLRKVLDINAVGTPMQLMITGGIIVLAVLVQGVRGSGLGAR